MRRIVAIATLLVLAAAGLPLAAAVPYTCPHRHAAAEGAHCPIPAPPPPACHATSTSERQADATTVGVSTISCDCGSALGAQTVPLRAAPPARDTLFEAAPAGTCLFGETERSELTSVRLVFVPPS